VILGDVQQHMLSREMTQGLGYGRTRIDTITNSQGRGTVIVTREGWVPTAPRGWRIKEEVTIGARGKVSRKTFSQANSKPTSGVDK
jgi:hypothetical protein